MELCIAKLFNTSVCKGIQFTVAKKMVDVDFTRMHGGLKSFKKAN